MSRRDAEVLQSWWKHALAHRELSPEIQPVLTRLVRAVGRGELPDRGAVFVKLMTFPRLRDRLRYALRALPAAHEAKMLRKAHAAGLTVPRVLASWTLRSSTSDSGDP